MCQHSHLYSSISPAGLRIKPTFISYNDHLWPHGRLVFKLKNKQKNQIILKRLKKNLLGQSHLFLKIHKVLWSKVEEKKYLRIPSRLNIKPTSMSRLPYYQVHCCKEPFVSSKEPSDQIPIGHSWTLGRGGDLSEQPFERGFPSGHCSAILPILDWYLQLPRAFVFSSSVFVHSLQEWRQEWQLIGSQDGA